jgi:hypothetical protein
MSKSQRFVFLGLAAVIAVVALALIGSGGDEPESSTPSAVVETATPTPTSSPADEDEEAEPTPTPTPKPKPEIPVLSADDPKRIKAEQGDTVRFAVESDVDEEVHLHGYDQSKDVKAGGRAVMTVKADITGIFEIELEHSGTPVGELEVRP